MSKYETPPGWSLPDDLADRIGEVMNQKPKSPENDFAVALDEMARDIALIEPNPIDWGWYVTHLLEKMEEEANKVRNSAAYEAMLHDLRDVLEAHIKGDKR